MKQIELIGPPLYQWDTGRRVRVSVRGATEAHFAIAGSARALVTPVVGGEAPVPSLLLTAGADRHRRGRLGLHRRRHREPVHLQGLVGGVDMAWIKLGNLKGPVGETGPQGPAASTAQTFLAAHPVGSLYMESKGKNPGATYGGTWSMRDSQNGFIWERTA